MNTTAMSVEVSTTDSSWKLIPLGELVEILDSKRKPITKRDRVAGPYPYYGATGTLDWVSEFLFDEPLVLIGEDGAKWAAGENSAFAISGKTWVNNHAHALRPRRNRVIDDWLIYYLNAKDLSEFISGMTVPTLNQGRLREIPVPLPPVDEQKRIVAILDQAFAALDRARAHAEANLAAAVELKNRSVEYELSLDLLGPPEPIGPDVDLLTGFAFKSNAYSDASNDIRLIRGDNIVQGSFRWDGVKHWPIDDRETYEKYELALDDVLIAMDRTWVSTGIKYAIVDEAALPSLLVQRVARLRAKQSVLPRYLGYWVGSKMFEKYVLSIQTGLGVPHVSGKQIESFPIRVPSVAAQRAVVDRLDAIVERCSGLISAYEQKLSDLADLRQSLLQKAFSGELV